MKKVLTVAVIIFLFGILVVNVSSDGIIISHWLDHEEIDGDGLSFLIYGWFNFMCGIGFGVLGKKISGFLDKFSSKRVKETDGGKEELESI